MGLFGMFATMFTGGVYAVESCKEDNYTSKQREQARLDGKITYSVNGKDYLTSTGEQVFVWGGQVKSLKTGQIVYDMNKEYYMEQNRNALAEAKAKGKKYIRFYYHADPNSDRGYSSYPTEVSTLKRFEVYPIVYKNKDKGYIWDFAFYKRYYNGSELGDSIEITREEFEELGGDLMGMTPEQYEEQKRKEHNEFMKEVNKKLKKRR